MHKWIVLCNQPTGVFWYSTNLQGPETSTPLMSCFGYLYSGVWLQLKIARLQQRTSSDATSKIRWINDFGNITFMEKFLFVLFVRAEWKLCQLIYQHSELVVTLHFMYSLIREILILGTFLVLILIYSNHINNKIMKAFQKNSISTHSICSSQFIHWTFHIFAISFKHHNWTVE